MPEFWQFPTVSMGLGPINAIYQAMTNKYLANRGIKDLRLARVGVPRRRRDGRGRVARPAPGRGQRGLDNLTFVVNCNLQRLDGPVRGNGKIIQELEASSAAPAGTSSRSSGAGVGRCSPDTDGALVNLMNTTPDGDFQTYKAEDGAFIRDHFFGRDERALAGQGLVRRGHLAPAPRRPRLPQGVRRLQGGHGAQGPADRHPRQDVKGYGLGRTSRAATRPTR
jgi:pyruvate dehydrogenase E1 component